MTNATTSRFLLVIAALYSKNALADDGHESSSDTDQDTVIIGIGGAIELDLGDSSLHRGVNVMAEWEAIEGWLELEIGVSVLAANGAHEFPIDLVAKKPFQLTRRIELMVGAGPEVIPSTGAQSGTLLGAEVAVDLMFWPSRRVGVWVEPSYEVTFHDGVSHSFAATSGVFLAW